MYRMARTGPLASANGTPARGCQMKIANDVVLYSSMPFHHMSHTLEVLTTGAYSAVKLSASGPCYEVPMDVRGCVTVKMWETARRNPLGAPAWMCAAIGP